MSEFSIEFSLDPFPFFCNTFFIDISVVFQVRTLATVTLAVLSLSVATTAPRNLGTKSELSVSEPKSAVPDRLEFTPESRPTLTGLLLTWNPDFLKQKEHLLHFFKLELHILNFICLISENTKFSQHNGSFKFLCYLLNKWMAWTLQNNCILCNKNCIFIKNVK